jgi:hypothetical protein
LAKRRAHPEGQLRGVFDQQHTGTQGIYQHLLKAN